MPPCSYTHPFGYPNFLDILIPARPIVVLIVDFLNVFKSNWTSSLWILFVEKGITDNTFSTRLHIRLLMEFAFFKLQVNAEILKEF